MQNILLFSKESRGGAGIFLKQMHLFNKQQYKIFLYKKDSLSSLKDSEANFVIRDYPESEEPSIYKIGLFFKSLWFTYRIITLEKPKNILACDRYASIVILSLTFFGLIRRVNVFVLINNNVPEIDKRKPNVLYRYMLKTANKILFKRADTIIITSKEISHYVKDTFRYDMSHCIHIPHAVDFSQINKKIESNNKGLIQMKRDKRFKIISVGRFDAQKDFSTIVYAFHQALSSNGRNEMSLYLVGEGSEKTELQKLTKKLNVSKHVYFLGWQENVFPFLKLADIFIFSSFHEGFGTVLVEAMAVGLPVIATNTPFGPSEILGNGKYGIIVPIGDYKMMAKYILKLQGDKKKRKDFGKKASARSAIYNVRNISNLYKQLF